MLGSHSDKYVSGWDVSNETVFSHIFQYVSSFNCEWDVSNVTDIFYELHICYSSSFNQVVSSWNVSDVNNITIIYKYNI